jgi:hypothetical protein
MQVPKLKILIEAGGVGEVTVSYDANADGWTVQVLYTTRSGERIEALERQRGGVRVFATLVAAARCLAGLGWPAFRVDATGLDGEEPP